MFTATYVNLRYWFYAIGNTPAVNLLRDRALSDVQDGDQQTVKILCLACGDPRSLLFTTWCERGHNPKHVLEYTCCDMDAAVLARNLVLLTMITSKLHGGASSSNDNDWCRSMWNIFYHLYIPERELHLLQDHAKMLVRISESVDTWLESPYGNEIQFLSQDTLRQLRRYWSLYAETKSFSELQMYAFQVRGRTGVRNIYDNHIAGMGPVAHGARAAGALWAQGLRTMSRAFKEYWQTGVAGGNSVDVLALGNDGKGWVNPMFAISSAPSGDVAVHYGSDPLLGFHLAQVFNDTELLPEDVLVERVVQVASVQFRSWCSSFATRSKNGGLRVKIFCGEAIRLCHELQSYRSDLPPLTKLTRLYAGPWTSRPLVLDGLTTSSESGLYDVIDTSNLVDHAGMLNILPAVAPLLSLKASSVLYTESLLQTSEEITSSLSHMLCSDVSAMSLIVGLAPMGHLIRFTTDAAGNEALIPMMILQSSKNKVKQHRMRIPWRFPEGGDIQAVDSPNTGQQLGRRRSFDAEELAAFFFRVYLQMFAHEDVSGLESMFNSVLRQLTCPLASDLRYYSRLSLVVLLYLAKTNIVTDWQRCVERLVLRIENDRSLLVGGNGLQELYLHCRLFGLWAHSSVDQTPRHLVMTLHGPLRPPAGEKGPLVHADLLTVVFVTLVIPRKKLQVFTAGSPNTVGTPGLHLCVRQDDPRVGFENTFFAIQCSFGQVIKRWGLGDDTGCDIVEDIQGWRGSQDMIVTCPISAYMLLLGPRKSIRVALSVDTTPVTSVQFAPKLGVDMTVFECGLDDEERLWITEDAPGIHTTVSRAARHQPLEEGQPVPNSDPCIAHVNLNERHEAMSIQIRTDLNPSSTEGKALATGAKVTVRSSSPCTLLLKIGGCQARRLVYPFPVNGAAAKTTVSRKSFWIQVLVPIAPALFPGGYNLSPFPVVRDGSQFVPWGFPCVHLNQQPAIPVMRGSFDWLSGFMGHMLNESERAQNALPDEQRTPNGLLDLKESIHILFDSVVGRQEKLGPLGNFQLAYKHKKNSVDTLIFASSIRHDLDAGSILLDAYVVPLTDQRCAELVQALKRFVGGVPVMVKMSKDESILWKHLFPSLAERCRRSWTHKESCEYRAAGRIPLSTSFSQSPICSCGEGQALDAFPTSSICKPFAKYATRIAISPILPVPYLERSYSKETEREMTQSFSRLEIMQHESRKENHHLTISSSSGRVVAQTCNQCGAAKEDLKTCAGCGKVWYCSRDCQKAAWKDHKQTCGKK